MAKKETKERIQPFETGSYGPLPHTCRWIEEHDRRNKGTVAGFRKLKIDYICNHTWKAYIGENQPQYLGPQEVIEIAKALDMPHHWEHEPFLQASFEDWLESDEQDELDKAFDDWLENTASDAFKDDTFDADFEAAFNHM